MVFERVVLLYKEINDVGASNLVGRNDIGMSNLAGCT